MVATRTSICPSIRKYTCESRNDIEMTLDHDSENVIEAKHIDLSK
jgi:hypothetical protein